MIGGKIYTWAQFAALPTDPAALWPILQADSTVGVAPYKGVPEQDWLYQTIIMTLEQDPVSPAMRVALLADAETISGVTVVGKYTDSLGRTGIALRQGSADTEVIDTSNGQVLTDIQPAPAHQGCTTFKYPTFSAGKDGKRLGPTTTSTGISCDFGGATLFLSAGATNTEPHVNQPTPFLSAGPAPSAWRACRALRKGTAHIPLLRSSAPQVVPRWCLNRRPRRPPVQVLTLMRARINAICLRKTRKDATLPADRPICTT